MGLKKAESSSLAAESSRKHIPLDSSQDGKISLPLTFSCEGAVCLQNNASQETPTLSLKMLAGISIPNLISVLSHEFCQEASHPGLQTSVFQENAKAEAGHAQHDKVATRQSQPSVSHGDAAVVEDMTSFRRTERHRHNKDLPIESVHMFTQTDRRDVVLASDGDSKRELIGTLAEGLGDLLADRDHCVREAAVGALSCLAQADTIAADAVAARLERPECFTPHYLLVRDMRLNALKALKGASIGPHGCPHAAAVAHARLVESHVEHSDVSVRKMAKAALKAIQKALTNQSSDGNEAMIAVPAAERTELEELPVQTCVEGLDLPQEKPVGNIVSASDGCGEDTIDNLMERVRHVVEKSVQAPEEIVGHMEPLMADDTHDVDTPNQRHRAGKKHKKRSLNGQDSSSSTMPTANSNQRISMEEPGLLCDAESNRDNTYTSGAHVYCRLIQTEAESSSVIQTFYPIVAEDCLGNLLRHAPDVDIRRRCAMWTYGKQMRHEIDVWIQQQQILPIFKLPFQQKAALLQLIRFAMQTDVRDFCCLAGLGARHARALQEEAHALHIRTHRDRGSLSSPLQSTHMLWNKLWQLLYPEEDFYCGTDMEPRFLLEMSSQDLLGGTRYHKTWPVLWHSRGSMRDSKHGKSATTSSEHTEDLGLGTITKGRMLTDYQSKGAHVPVVVRRLLNTRWRRVQMQKEPWNKHLEFVYWRGLVSLSKRFNVLHQLGSGLELDLEIIDGIIDRIMKPTTVKASPLRWQKKQSVSACSEK